MTWTNIEAWRRRGWRLVGLDVATGVGGGVGGSLFFAGHPVLAWLAWGVAAFFGLMAVATVILIWESYGDP